ncbi:MAG: glycosyltransferase family 4 protein [Gemmatimonadota bacterium]|nr:glycosyltransferase family 4 protein [Gemmatimonadota bacterium]
MKLCFVADFRSPIARNWIRHFADGGHEVHVISTFQSGSMDIPVASLHVVPLGLSSLRGQAASVAEGGDGTPAAGVATRLKAAARRLSGIGMELHQLAAPLHVFKQRHTVRRLIDDIRPDLVHAMRIPFEGILAAEALRDRETPLVVSVWGNDFTLFGARYPLIGWTTRRAMRRADALHSDCLRDHQLRIEWGFDGGRPSVVLPGAGGVQEETFHEGPAPRELVESLAIPEGAPVVINPRGFRSYVRNDTFFRAIPLVLRERPDAVFVGVGMAGNPTATGWVRRLDVEPAVRLLSVVPRRTMADLFRLADVTVSPSEHDGTPNTLLESMACGAFPVAGDIPSVREWIEPGANGLLVDPGDPRALADAVLQAIADPRLRSDAAAVNRRLVAERAAYETVMRKAECFYAEVLAHTGRGGPA